MTEINLEAILSSWTTAIIEIGAKGSNEYKKLKEQGLNAYAKKHFFKPVDKTQKFRAGSCVYQILKTKHGRRSF